MQWIPLIVSRLVFLSSLLIYASVQLHYRFALSATDRLTMCRDAYLIADEMLKARGA